MMAAVLRHHRQGKPDMAEKCLAEPERQPESGDGHRPLLVQRCGCCASRTTAAPTDSKENGSGSLS